MGVGFKYNDMPKHFNLEDFDLDTLTGHAKTTINSTDCIGNELNAIARACKEQSCKMGEYHKVDYDNFPYQTIRRKSDSGESCLDIIFGFEVKTK